jgi:hypothetical protein
MMNIRLLIIAIFGIFLSGCGGDSTNEPTVKVLKEVSTQKLNEAIRYRELANLYVGKTVPYEKYEEIGKPETLSGTNNVQWVAYFPKADFTIVTDKKTDIVKTIYTGSHPF